MFMWLTIILCVLAYLIGSVSSAVLVCRAAGLPDPRNQGSKNPGATNVLRMGGKKLAIFTLLGDVLKGVIAVGIALAINPEPQAVGLVMVAVFFGHLYPIFFGFAGGKGVATAAGVITMVSWPTGLLLILTWGGIIMIFRRSSLAALITALLAPVYILYWRPEYFWPVIIISAFLIGRHRSNIRRLLEGTEPKLGQNKSNN